MHNLNLMSLDECLAATAFAVEASNFERHCLWNTHHEQVHWKSCNAGYGVNIGKCAGMPVFVSVIFSVIDGHVVLFYEPTSQVVDWRMVEEWLKTTVPCTWKDNHWVGKADANNFHLCLNALRKLNEPAAIAA